MLLESTRVFRLWMYSVSHCRLLVRSIGKGGEKNIDVKLQGVEFISLPASMTGLKLSEIKFDRHGAFARYGVGQDARLFEFESAGHTYVVAAAMIEIDENSLEYSEIGDW